MMNSTCDDIVYFHSNEGQLLKYELSSQKQTYYEQIHLEGEEPDGVCISPDNKMVFSVDTWSNIVQHDLINDKKVNDYDKQAHRGIYTCKMTPDGKHFFATNVYGDMFEWLYEKKSQRLSQYMSENFWSYNNESSVKCPLPCCDHLRKLEKSNYDNPRQCVKYARVTDYVITKDSKWVIGGGGDMSIFTLDIDNHKVTKHWEELEPSKNGNCVYKMVISEDNKTLYVAWDHNTHDKLNREVSKKLYKRQKKI